MAKSRYLKGNLGIKSVEQWVAKSLLWNGKMFVKNRFTTITKSGWKFGPALQANADGKSYRLYCKGDSIVLAKHFKRLSRSIDFYRYSKFGIVAAFRPGKITFLAIPTKGELNMIQALSEKLMIQALEQKKICIMCKESKPIVHSEKCRDCLDKIERYAKTQDYKRYLP